MAHRLGDRRVDRRDPLVHRLGDGAVGGVALAARAQLDQVHRLAGVEVEHVADPVGEAERVGRLLGEAGVGEPLVLGPRDLERPLELAAEPRFLDLAGDAGAEVGAEPLPLAGQHPVALEVAEGAVVGDDLEAVAQRLEAAAGPVAAVGALADQRGEQLGPLGRGRGRRGGRGSRSPASRADSNRQEASRSSSVPSTWISSTEGASAPAPRRSRPSRETHCSVASRRRSR